MAWSFLQGGVGSGAKASRLDLASDLGADDVFAPLLAGAYMRGLSDLLGLFDLAAVFLDLSGRILATNDAASFVLKGDLRIEASHLVGGTASDNAALSRLIDDAVRGISILEPEIFGLGTFVVTVLPLPESVPASPVAAVLVAASGTDRAARAVLDLLSSARRRSVGLGQESR